MTSHSKIRCNCEKCSYQNHDGHASHGVGSFKETHPKYCKKHTCHDPGSRKFKRKTYLPHEHSDACSGNVQRGGRYDRSYSRYRKRRKDAGTKRRKKPSGGGVTITRSRPVKYISRR